MLFHSRPKLSSFIIPQPHNSAPILVSTDTAHLPLDWNQSSYSPWLGKILTDGLWNESIDNILISLIELVICRSTSTLWNFVFALFIAVRSESSIKAFSLFVIYGEGSPWSFLIMHLMDLENDSKSLKCFVCQKRKVYNDYWGGISLGFFILQEGSRCHPSHLIHDDES